MIDEIILNALKEDIGDGDHSTLSSVPENAQGVAKLLVKDTGVIAGVELAVKIFHTFDPTLKVNVFIKDSERYR